MKKFFKGFAVIVIAGLLLLSAFGCNDEEAYTYESSETVPDSTDTESAPADTSDDSKESTDGDEDDDTTKPDGVGEIFDWNDG